CRRYQAEQHLNGSRLAGAVRAQEAENLTLAHRQGEVGHCHFFSELLTQSMSLEDKIAHSPFIQNVYFCPAEFIATSLPFAQGPSCVFPLRVRRPCHFPTRAGSSLVRSPADPA